MEMSLVNVTLTLMEAAHSGVGLDASRKNEDDDVCVSVSHVRVVMRVNVGDVLGPSWRCGDQGEERTGEEIDYDGHSLHCYSNHLCK